jgi:rare lipoprotein A
LLITGKQYKQCMKCINQLKEHRQQFVLCLLAVIFCCFSFTVTGQNDTPKVVKKGVSKVLYGTASFYSNKFNGRKTANGEIYSQAKFTCACNVLPLGTWLKVTNMRNGKSVIVKVNDRLHPKMRRLVDLTRAAAQKLSYVDSGLTRVKVEVLGKNYR